ncbi:FtsK/SpoIIIE domain-containing protein [Paenarthrobacter sp. FR1]|uniref:FtsK/SpoIIIE domain-containing protein n=1 Tax=Paenarthrobacter sp. FR1 TaxID=3439548 RepID=UPI003DA1DAF3
MSTLTVGLPPLVSGAVVVDGGAPPSHPEAGPVRLMLLAHSGPGAGSVFRIHRGRFRIGRGSTDIRVADPGMSREHAVLEVSSTAVTLSDIEGANPVFIDDRPTHQKQLASDSRIRCGNSTFTVFTDAGPLPQISADAGRSVEEPLEVQHTRSPGHRFSMALAAGLPLAAGIGLAVVTGMWAYLGFTAISAFGLLVPLFAGRKSRRDLSLAVAKSVQVDIERRRRSSPSAADIVMDTHRRAAVGAAAEETSQGKVLPTPTAATAVGVSPGDPGVWLRLGTTRALANVRLAPDDPHFRPPPIGFAAVNLDPRHQLVVIRGQAAYVDALLRFMVMQLVSYPASAGTSIIILGQIERLPLSARFLSRVTLASTPTVALAALLQRSGSPPGRLVIVNEPTSDETQPTSSLLASARVAGWQVIQHLPSSEQPGHVIEIGDAGTTGHMEMDGERRPFIPDLVPCEVFDAFCRNMAATACHEGSELSHVIPDKCSLPDLLPTGPRRILRRWGATAVANGLSAVLGKGRHGLVAFDFKYDGPHLLVAGTTGSGKSELLRTLVASMTLVDSPERITFMFFDFKGGSGLGPLAGLPHCVGLLTDLGKHDLDRTLASLRGEIRRREELFAAAQVSDISQYQHMASSKDPNVPYLVLVIDEFRMLVDEAPSALRELMRVATIGRSLGIHLVMATQRPQGALTADIRANVTSSIALRVQSDVESVDIIGSKAAASIPVEAPGRAFLARASSDAEEFQTASIEGVPMAGETHGRRQHPVQTALQVLQRRPDEAGRAGRHDASSDGSAKWVVSAVNGAWQRLGKPLPRRPVAPPLATEIPWNEDLPAPEAQVRSNTDSPWVVGPLGLADKPAQQVVEPLLWSPARHGHLAMIGSASSGMQNCFRAVSAMLATQGPQPHLYILDATGLLGDFVEHGRIGAIAGLHQLPSAARVLQRLAAELARRHTVGEVEGEHSPLVLVVAGWCSWATALRAGPFGWAEGSLLDIVRDGRSVGITVLISGERELVGSRFFAAVQNRAYFPYGSTDESRFHWPRLPGMEAVPGRAAVTGTIVDGSTVVAQFREAPDSEAWPFARLLPAAPPFRVRPLPELLSEQVFQTHLTDGTSAGKSQCRLWIGLGGDEALPMSLPLPAQGVSLVLGSRRSGKSTVLGSLQSLNSSVRWVFPPNAALPGPFWASVAQEAAAGDLDTNSVLLVDDADCLDVQGRQALAALAGKVRGIVLTATVGPSLMQNLPLVREVQYSRVGLILAPQTAHDGDLLGVRLELDRAGRPGRGFVVNGAEVTPFQAVLTAGVWPPSPTASEEDG